MSFGRGGAGNISFAEASEQERKLGPRKFDVSNADTNFTLPKSRKGKIAQYHHGFHYSIRLMCYLNSGQSSSYPCNSMLPCPSLCFNSLNINFFHSKIIAWFEKMLKRKSGFRGKFQTGYSLHSFYIGRPSTP